MVVIHSRKGRIIIMYLILIYDIIPYNIKIYLKQKVWSGFRITGWYNHWIWKEYPTV